MGDYTAEKNCEETKVFSGDFERSTLYFASIYGQRAFFGGKLCIFFQIILTFLICPP